MLKNNQKKDIIQTPIRMCVVCKERNAQKNLHRFQIKASQIIRFSGVGRSYYVCAACLKKDEKVLQKAYSKLNKGIIELNLKETFFNGES